MLPSRFQFYCQHVLPLVYDESLSYYEVLCKLGEYIKTLTQDVESVEGLISGLQTSYQALLAQFNAHEASNAQEFAAIRDQMQIDYDDLQGQIEAVKNEGITPALEAALQQYIEENLQSYVADIVKYVMFGLDNTGHFVAYIPPSWQFIEFGSIEDATSPLYGHLTVSW